RGFEAAALDGQCVGALGLLAGAHATRADDAQVVVETEIRIAVVDGFMGMRMTRGLRTGESRLADAVLAGQRFELAAAGVRAAAHGMFGDVQLEHTATQLRQRFTLRAYLHPRRHLGGTGSREALAAVDLDQTHTAGSEMF